MKFLGRRSEERLEISGCSDKILCDGVMECQTPKQTGGYVDTILLKNKTG